MDTVNIKRNELRALLFWAMSGFTSSNGGTHERAIPKIIAKYCKELNLRKTEFPPLGVKSYAELYGDTKTALLIELQKVGYKSVDKI